MVVVFILGLLVTLVAPRIIGRTDEARVDQGAGRHQGDRGGAAPVQARQRLLPDARPKASAALVQRAAERARSWNPDGYLDKLPIDPWGNEYVYHSDGRDVLVKSLRRRRRRGRRRLQCRHRQPRPTERATPTETSWLNDRRTDSRRIGDAGFTLIEIGLVLLIITVVLGADRPAACAIRRTPSSISQARRLAATFRFLREEAILNGRVYRLNFDLDQQRYFVTSSADARRRRDRRLRAQSGHRWRATVALRRRSGSPT